jgi:hypothetical protein
VGLRTAAAAVAFGMAGATLVIGCFTTIDESLLDRPTDAGKGDGAAGDVDVSSDAAGGDGSVTDGGTPDDPVPDAGTLTDAAVIPDGGLVMFVTSKGYDGKLGSAGEINAKCNELVIGTPWANRQFVAFIRNAAGFPTIDVSGTPGIYLTDGTLVWNQSPNTVSPLARPMRNELNGPLNKGARAWIGSDVDRCSDWQANGSEQKAQVGDPFSAEFWMNAASTGSLLECNLPARLYCFEIR